MIDNKYIDANTIDELSERIVFINRVSKVVKGGRRFGFSALMVAGDGKGHVGIGLGKANEVPDAIRKGNDKARKEIFKVPLDGTTIPHTIEAQYGAGHVFLRPASPGTGLIAGGPVRIILEAAGIRDVLAKCIGTTNPHNAVHATIKALQSLESASDVAERRGIDVKRVVSDKGWG